MSLLVPRRAPPPTRSSTEAWRRKQPRRASPTSSGSTARSAAARSCARHARPAPPLGRTVAAPGPSRPRRRERARWRASSPGELVPPGTPAS
ncbi:MAG: hypothetical protein M0C28_16105 [Candidatus Moduliflexus flocculans]|nr:hypothetical protein [Candidatus Moduliflexus flocculans]